MDTPSTQTSSATNLLKAVEFGKLHLRNRFAVAPMTRVTATAEGLVTAQMHDYYLRFSEGGFGLIITEGLYTDQAFSQGYPDQPGLALDEQANSWTPTVRALQRGGTKVVAQIMHSGALSQGNRFKPHTVAPSAIQPKGQQMSVYYGKGAYAVPERISDDQIEEVIRGFADTTARAILMSGFDGVEIHAANGYLLDQFISAETNTRTDHWGGDQHARMTLVIRVVQAIREAVGSEATIGVRISQGKVNDFTYKWSGGVKDAAVIFGALKDAGVDYIHVTEFDASYPAFDGDGETLLQLASRFAPGVPLIANGTLHDLDAANVVLRQGAGLVALGRGALANPDLPHRLATGAPLQAFDDAVLKPIATIKNEELKAKILPGRKTIRLKIPQWQGGDNPPTAFGSELLAFLAPDSSAPTFVVPVQPYSGRITQIEDGVAHRTAINQQLDAAMAVLKREAPDRVVVFGGDCLVDQAPFAYLNERYAGNLGVLWLDAHPDIKTPADYANAHTMVLANLIGEGDAALAAKVPVHIDPRKVMFAGLRSDGLTKQEIDFISRHAIPAASAAALSGTSAPVLEWIAANQISHLAIHFDLDVLDPTEFRSVFFGEPKPANDPYAAFPAGRMSIADVLGLLRDVSAATDVVGLGITEHIPWDAIALKNLMRNIPILN